jgi:UDP-N-acetyl-D-glucosamine dehydrogenase
VARKYGLTTRFIELAGEVNTNMPHFVVARVADALNERGKPVKGSKVTLLGMAYKKDADDCRESPGFELMELLLRKGAVVQSNDPHIARLPPTRNHFAIATTGPKGKPVIRQRRPGASGAAAGRPRASLLPPRGPPALRKDEG